MFVITVIGYVVIELKIYELDVKDFKVKVTLVCGVIIVNVMYKYTIVVIIYSIFITK